MARVSMWQQEGYPVTKLTRVDWDGMTMEWESGGPNLFYLSASVVIAFGGPRDATALMRDLVRLLGLGRHGHSTVYRWMTVRDRSRRPGRHPSLTATPSPLRNRRQLPASPRHKRRGR